MSKRQKIDRRFKAVSARIKAPIDSRWKPYNKARIIEYQWTDDVQFEAKGDTIHLLVSTSSWEYESQTPSRRVVWSHDEALKVADAIYKIVYDAKEFDRNDGLPEPKAEDQYWRVSGTAASSSSTQ